jgi:hypothetical protein
MKELKLTNHDNRPPSGHDRDLRVPSTLDRQGSMELQHTNATIRISGRWWCFPGAQIDGDSWEGEWRSDGKLRLHDSIGNMVEGRELSEAETEQLCREMLLADVLELAAARLRSGEGWDEGTTTDVLNEIEIEHVTGGRRQPDRLPESME